MLPIKAVYFSLGESLRLSSHDLKAIRGAYPDKSMADQGLKDVLLLWLNQKYRVEEFGPPTWRVLVEAVDKKTGGNNHELAKEIASNHPTGMSLLDIVLALYSCNPMLMYDNVQLVAWTTLFVLKSCSSNFCKHERNP